ncbi:ABC transporter substrate-binding protein [Lacrimispora sp.]|uniref:ABC transporter substrate-binding protein n=1 Tax=Lacrimispora sp. TaxID=2719234 RepID=UPI003460E464
MKKRILSMVLCLCMSAALVSGCSKNGETQKDSAGETTEKTAAVKEKNNVLKWAVWDNETTPYYKALKEAFEKEHEGVTVEIVDFSSNDYITVLATELSGSGSDFDVVSIKEIPQYATLVSKGVIVPLDSYIEKEGIDLTAYNGITDQMTIDDTLYQMPFRSDFWVIYYNKDIFDRAGVAYPTNDMTWDQYADLARKVTDTSFDNRVYGSHFHTWKGAVALPAQLDGVHSILDGNYDFFKPYYERVQALEDEGVCQDYLSLNTEGLHYSAAFSNGNVAMMNMGSWFVGNIISSLNSGDYDKEACGNWGIVKYPHEEGVAPGTSSSTVTGISITNVADDADLAWEFVNFVSGDQGAQVLAETGNFAAKFTDSAKETILSMDGFPQDDASKEALNVEQLYLEVPYGKNIAEINNILNTYHKDIMTRDLTIDEGIAKMNEEVQKLMQN